MGEGPNTELPQSFVPQESVRQNETGIIRNETGRIIQTGWLTVPRDQWRNAYQELGKRVAKQVRYELFIKSSGTRTKEGYDVLPGVGFVLSTTPLADDLRVEVESRVHPSSATAISVCDIGGGAGDMLASAMARLKGANASTDAMIDTTLTTLVHHDKDIKERYGDRIDHVRTLAVELPSDEFYQAYDVITCQNSVFNWTTNPELATLNLWKMLKKGGVVIGTAYTKPRNIDGQDFDTIAFLRNHPLFDFEERDKLYNGAAISFRLRKKEENPKPQTSQTAQIFT